MTTCHMTQTRVRTRAPRENTPPGGAQTTRGHATSALKLPTKGYPLHEVSQSLAESHMDETYVTRVSKAMRFPNDSKHDPNQLTS